MRFWVGVLLIILTAGPASFGQTPQEPSLQAVADQALKYAHLETRTIQNWENNVRKAPLLPRFQFGFARAIRNGVDVNLEDSVAVNSSGVTVGPTQSRQVQNANSDLNFEVKAVWYLDQLLFSQDHLGISKETRYLAMERDRLLSEVRRYFFQRERLLKSLGLLRRMHTSAAEREIKELELDEATAALDQLTGGWFSAQIREVP